MQIDHTFRVEQLNIRRTSEVKKVENTGADPGFYKGGSDYNLHALW